MLAVTLAVLVGACAGGSGGNPDRRDGRVDGAQPPVTEQAAGATSAPPASAAPETSTAAPETATEVPASTATAVSGADDATSSPLPPTASTETATAVPVTRVADGDTFTVRIGSVEERVRLIGVDTPETGECWSAEATSVLRELLGGEVVLVADETDRDRFGRLLRYAERDGIDLGVEMVRRGAAIARSFPPDTARQRLLDDAERIARAEAVGLWAPDACGPVTAAELAVTAINENPPGDDLLDLNGEWVEVTNRGTAPIDLTGWTVRDESASHRYVFPAGFVLGPDATVRLHTGCGPDSATSLHWCAERSAVWNNSGDTVFVLDPNGNVVTSRSFTG
jgi:endonuclease YncB( thermonuclease family)